MDLTTSYLGLKLKSPLVPSASPLSQEVADIQRMEEAGAAAVVLYSLFEEQFLHEEKEAQHYEVEGTDSFAEALSYLPKPEEYKIGRAGYLEHIRKAKAAVSIPIIASLNGISKGSWIKYAKEIEEAGADALELNTYFLPTNMEETGAQVEQRYLEILQAVKAEIKIPVTVKLAPYFSSMANMAKRLDQAGADGLVLFNRFYQADIDLQEMELRPALTLSTSYSRLLPLTWIGILHGRVKASLAATRGIHCGEDAIKMILAGADVTQLCATLLRHGIGHLRAVEKQMRTWMEEHEYESVAQMKGALSQQKCAHPSMYERGQYIKTLHSFSAMV